MMFIGELLSLIFFDSNFVQLFSIPIPYPEDRLSQKINRFSSKKKKNPSNLKCGAQSELIVYNQSSKIKLPFYRLPEFEHLSLH